MRTRDDLLIKLLATMVCNFNRRSYQQLLDRGLNLNLVEVIEVCTSPRMTSPNLIFNDIMGIPREDAKSLETSKGSAERYV